MITPAAPPWWSGARRRALLRALLSAHVLNGASVAVGMFLVTTLVHAGWGAEAAANATVGVITALVTEAQRSRCSSSGACCWCPPPSSLSSAWPGASAACRWRSP